MNSFFWFLVSGVTWLGVVWISPELHIAPQLVSLARSGYIGLFSVFLILELRGSGVEGGGQVAFRQADLPWLFVPITSVFLLSAISDEFQITPTDIVAVLCFFCTSLLTLIFRVTRGTIKNVAWESLPPILFLIVIVLPIYAQIALAAVFLIVAIRGLGRADPAASSGPGVGDSLFSQLPSLCIAPAIIIGLRDYINFGDDIGRQYTEMFGLVVNGVGGAAWGAMVIRFGQKLDLFTYALWFAGVAMVLVSLAIPPEIVQALFLLAAFELLRGSQWLGITRLLLIHRGLAAFLINLVLTLVPVLAIVLAEISLAKSYEGLAAAIGYFMVCIFVFADRLRSNRLAEKA
ncbi:putative membrane protein [Blastomonas sp. RAC04]|uniref:hypothetical protein n=1 Tax=Blastomonas sp. RAC04 TaxID=1842535 RepID=UPI00083D72BF|nr:hypothetical protein [Blastomonas sp. RAC04]AOF99762.1 putative membrane protein [Blastomonas sp. RAC04]